MVDGAADDWVEVAVVGRPHGVRGDVYTRLYNPATTLLEVGRVLHWLGSGAPLGGRDEARRPLEVERVRGTAKGPIVKFVGVDQREVAAALTNGRLYVRRAALPEIPADEVYCHDLLGLTVVALEGDEMGRIVGFFDNGAHDVCVAERADGSELWLPFAPENLVDVDFEAKRVILDLPEGLDELGGGSGDGSE